MTDIEFIEAAKRECLKKIRKNHVDSDMCIFRADMTWYCSELTNYKALFRVHDIAHHKYEEYYEVTYVRAEHSLVVDTYRLESTYMSGYDANLK